LPSCTDDDETSTGTDTESNALDRARDVPAGACLWETNEHGLIDEDNPGRVESILIPEEAAREEWNAQGLEIVGRHRVEQCLGFFARRGALLQRQLLRRFERTRRARHPRHDAGAGLDRFASAACQAATKAAAEWATSVALRPGRYSAEPSPKPTAPAATKASMFSGVIPPTVAAPGATSSPAAFAARERLGGVEGHLDQAEARRVQRGADVARFPRLDTAQDCEARFGLQPESEASTREAGARTLNTSPSGGVPHENSSRWS
jgi:hypothetical protein